jgi:hypothetical protein
MTPETEELLRRKLEREERKRKANDRVGGITIVLAGLVIWGVWSMINAAETDPHRQTPPYPVCVNAPDGRGGYREVCTGRRHYADDPPEPISTEIGVWCQTYEDGQRAAVRLFSVYQPAGGRIEESDSYYEMSLGISSVRSRFQRHGDTYVLGSTAETETSTMQYQVTPNGLRAFLHGRESLLPEGSCD